MTLSELKAISRVNGIMCAGIAMSDLITLLERAEVWVSCARNLGGLNDKEADEIDQLFSDIAELNGGEK